MAPEKSTKRQQRKTSFACQACRLRKTKCSGLPSPCDQCAKVTTKCFFDPDTDLRRKSFKANHKAYSSLLDEYIVSTRSGDANQANGLYQLIRQADASGKLAEIARAVSQALTKNERPVYNQAQTTASDGKVVTQANQSTTGEARSLVLIDSSSHTPSTFEVPHSFWAEHASDMSKLQLIRNFLPGFACDFAHLEPKDPMSKSIISFRDLARQEISRGTPLTSIVETPMPNLNLFYARGAPPHPFSVWTWASHFAQAFSHLPLTLQLAAIMLGGLQMRYFIYPCAETYNDLPPMLRPLKEQYTVPHAAGIDICHYPVLKQYQLRDWDQFDKLYVSGQSANWRYCDNSCFDYREDTDTLTMSQAFMEHISILKNYSVGPGILDQVPEMREFVREPA